MASLCDDLYNIKMDGFYKISGKSSAGLGKAEILADSYTINIQSNNKNQCFNESFKTEWHIIYLTITDHGGIKKLKIQRDAKKRSCITRIPGDASSGEILQLQRHNICFDELEYRAIGVMTLRPRDCSGDIVVCPIHEAKIYVKEPRPLQQCPLAFIRAFGSFLFSFDDQKLNYSKLKSA